MYQLILLRFHILSITVLSFFHVSQLTVDLFSMSKRDTGLDNMVQANVPSAKQTGPVNKHLITDFP